MRANENKIKKQKDLFNGNSYKVYVTASPEDGKANKKVIELLADYFKVAKAQVKIIKGEVSRNKIIEIEGI